MSALESLIATSGEAPLLDSLDFSLPPSSTAVVDRRQHVKAYPTSASTLTPTATRTFRIRLGGDDFIDPASLRLQYTVRNLDAAKNLQPVVGPWGMWSQVYLRSGGVLLDDIPFYGRHHQQFGWNHLSQLEQFGESGISGFGGSWDTGQIQANTPNMGYIRANRSYTVMHRLLLSIFSSGKLLPTRYMPMELECTLGANADWLSLAVSDSTTFAIENIQLLYDAYSLDEAVLDSFYKALLANRVLSIPTITVYQVVQSIPANSTSFSFAAVRAFSRLSHVWLTFRKVGARSREFACPTLTSGAGDQPELEDAAPSARLSIGPKNWPDAAPAATTPELFYMFQKTLPGVPNITRDDFFANAFTIVFDVRRMPSDPTSSISTRSGDLLRVDLKNLTANEVTECYMTLFAFSVTAVRESGVTLLT